MDEQLQLQRKYTRMIEFDCSDLQQSRCNLLGSFGTAELYLLDFDVAHFYVRENKEQLDEWHQFEGNQVFAFLEFLEKCEAAHDLQTALHSALENDLLSTE